MMNTNDKIKKYYDGLDTAEQKFGFITRLLRTVEPEKFFNEQSKAFYQSPC